MQKESLSRNAIVLLKSAQEEKFVSYKILTSEEGVLNVLQRISRNKAQADLFDIIEIEIEQKAQGAVFVKELRVLKHFDGIATDYKKLMEASEWSRFLIKNLPFHEAGADIFLLSYKMLNALHHYNQSFLIAIKAYYSFAKLEGYPVKESWYTSLNPKEMGQIRDLLSQPVEKLLFDDDDCKSLLTKLKAWLKSETELFL